MYTVMAFISGLIMSAGLIISGMVNPQKVIGFLDLFGHFDPTLAFVMAGALSVTAVGYRLIGRSKPLLCESYDMPKKHKIDRPLVMGAVLFGAGWGMAGFCPGPAIVGVGLGLYKAMVFVIAMLAGMFLARKIVNW
jgi:uncharacterized membrane protein YedE/YeeE